MRRAGPARPESSRRKMVPTHAKLVRLAAVQMVSENANIRGNLSRASNHVQDAGDRGARLIVLPEFMPIGYVFTTSSMIASVFSVTVCR